MPHPNSGRIPPRHAGEGHAALIGVGAGFSGYGLPLDFSGTARPVGDDALHHIYRHPRRGGTENLTAIPGTVGAAPVQNIGAYGAEAKDIVESVETLDLATLKEVSIAGCHCGFGYRDSIFKGVLKGRAVITAVTFRLSRTPRPNLGYDALAREVEDAGGATLENIRTAVRRIRGEKLPDPAVTGNAGSFFKNPVVDSELAERIKRKYPDMPSYPVPEGVKIPAGWLIEKTGWKGASLGRAGVYGKQALILVNLGGATGNEVTALARRITDDVETRFGIRIATEVNIW